MCGTLTKKLNVLLTNSIYFRQYIFVFCLSLANQVEVKYILLKCCYYILEVFFGKKVRGWILELLSRLV